MSDLKLQIEIQKAVDCLKSYVEKGGIVDQVTVDMEPIMAVEPKLENLKRLNQISTVTRNFAAVDCSSFPLKRGNHYGVYVLRVSTAAIFTGKDVQLSNEDHVVAVIGNEKRRMRELERLRFEFESETGLKIAQTLNEGDYLLLDGAGHFGGPRKFSIELYDYARKKGLILLALSKRTSAMTHSGSDFLTYLLTKDMTGVWLYHPYVRADTDTHLYGDISFVKLNSVPIAFRCDIMEYLTHGDLVELISPLTALARDARCPGYPVCLYLAHRNTQIATPKLLYYYSELERNLPEDVRRQLMIESNVANFRAVLYGAKYAWEWGGEVV